MKNYQNRSVDQPQKDQPTKTLLVSDYMVKVGKLITFKSDTPVMEVVEILLKNRISGAPVLDEKGAVIGLIDDKDCLNLVLGSTYYNHPVERDTVATYMSSVMKSISVDTNILSVANIFMTTPYKRLLIKDRNGKLAGQISRRDVLRAIKDMNKQTW